VSIFGSGTHPLSLPGTHLVVVVDEASGDRLQKSRRFKSDRDEIWYD